MLRNLFLNRKGILIGSAIAILIISFDIFLSTTQSDWFNRLTSIVYIFWNLIIILSGAISGYVIENYFIARSKKIGSTIGCIIGSVLISPVSYYFGIIFGALLGAYFHDIIISIFGFRLKEISTFVGMFIGISFIITLVESIGAMVGSVLGSLFGNLKRGGPLK